VMAIDHVTGCTPKKKKEKKNFPEYVFFVYIVLDIDNVTCFILKKASRMKVETRREIFRNMLQITNDGKWLL
jgi:hypothetical protein